VGERAAQRWSGVPGDGEKGELVFTSLTKEAFPVLRYRTRDLTRLLPGTARPGMRRMEKVTGRSDDMIILRGVNLFPTQIEEVLLATEWCGGHFLIELTREGRMDEMTVHAEARPERWDGSGLTDHAEKITAFIKNTIGISTQIRIVAPETLERSLGKAKRVVDKRPKG
jgi:phenylacetate-CoA ligase